MGDIWSAESFGYGYVIDPGIGYKMTPVRPLYVNSFFGMSKKCVWTSVTLAFDLEHPDVLSSVARAKWHLLDLSVSIPIGDTSNNVFDLSGTFTSDLKSPQMNHL